MAILGITLTSSLRLSSFQRTIKKSFERIVSNHHLTVMILTAKKLLPQN
jgi:hypothetical protein